MVRQSLVTTFDPPRCRALPTRFNTPTDAFRAKNYATLATSHVTACATTRARAEVQFEQLVRRIYHLRLLHRHSKNNLRSLADISRLCGSSNALRPASIAMRVDIAFYEFGIALISTSREGPQQP